MRPRVPAILASALATAALATAACFSDVAGDGSATQGSGSTTAGESTSTTTTTTSTSTSTSTATATSTSTMTSSTSSTTQDTSSTTLTTDATTDATGTTGVEPSIYEALCQELADKIAGCGVSMSDVYMTCVSNFMDATPECQEVSVPHLECALAAGCDELPSPTLCEEEKTRATIVCQACEQTLKPDADYCALEYACADSYVLACNLDQCICTRNGAEIGSCQITDLCSKDDAALLDAAVACCPWA